MTYNLRLFVHLDDSHVSEERHQIQARDIDHARHVAKSFCAQRYPTKRLLSVSFASATELVANVR